MRVLVTGGAGFIGHHVAKALLERGDEVIALDDFNDYYDPAQKLANAAQLAAFARCRMIHGDIRDAALLAHIFSTRPDVIVHLAGYAGVRNSVSHPSLYFDVNLRGSIGLLELARECSAGNFVFASTSSVYGHGSAVPFSESDPCVQPPQPYAASKRAVEQIGYTYHQHYGLNFTVLRFFTVYGPSGRPDMMPGLLAESLFCGRPVSVYAGQFFRDWTFVDDIVAGIVAAADRPLGYEIMNLGRGQPQSLSRFIAAMERAAGRSARLVPAAAPASEMATTWADVGKARRLLGYRPRIDIEEGTQRYCDWFREFHAGRIGAPETIQPQPAGQERTAA